MWHWWLVLAYLGVVFGEESSLRFVTTFCAGRDAAAGIHVLAESLLRAGHRQGIDVYASANCGDRDLALLAEAPLARVSVSPSLGAYCTSTKATDECAHLALLAFEDEATTTTTGIRVLLAPDSVVLRSLDALMDAAAFSAVRSVHEDGYDLQTMVIRSDARVAEMLRESLCASENEGALETIRKMVPYEVWSALDDAYAVPADHLDTAWYKHTDANAAVVRFDLSPRPWQWWLDSRRFSLVAATHWCQAAAFTPYNCGWGREAEPKAVGSVDSEQASVPQLAPSQPIGSSTATKFGVLLSTYSRPTWRVLARHYAAMKCVSKVYLVWHDPTADAPPAREVGANVVILRARVDSLNNRFAAPPGVAYPEAMYVCDDDIWPNEKSLLHAFAIWKGNTRRLVGMFPRKWAAAGDAKYSARISDGYNIVLTKGVFVHRAFLFMYDRLLPATVKSVVDRHKNCEDILLNVMVSRYTRLPPLHVLTEEAILDLGHHAGISKRGSHFTVRRQCVDDIVDGLRISGWQPPVTFGSLSVRPLKNRERK